MNELFCNVTSMSYESGYDELVKCNVEFIGNDIRVMEQFRNSMYQPFNGLRLAGEEFMCMWCGSPNPITNRHCSQCGGTRGFIIK